MLVSSIARLNAIDTMNSASFSSMQVMNSTASAMRNLNISGGEHDLAMLNNLDKKNSLDLSANNLLYKISYLQEKQAAKHNKLNLLA